MNDEYRMSNDEGMTKSEYRNGNRDNHSGSVIRHYFVIRALSFVPTFATRA